MTALAAMKERQEVVLTAPAFRDHNPHCVSTEEEEQLPYPTLAPVVFRFLKQTTRPRNWCLQMARSQWFSFVSILMVLISCGSLAKYKPGVENSFNLKVVDFLVFAFFMVEMLMKMVALGVFGYEGTYLRNHWNKLDVFINSGVVFDYVLNYFGIYSEVRQVLGPMRLIGRVPGMRNVVTVLADTLPMLANVLVLYFIVIHIFAIVGVQLWAGQLRNRCFRREVISTEYNGSLSPYYMANYGDKLPFICSLDGNSGMQRCRDVPPYEENGVQCLSAAPDDISAEIGFALPTLASKNSCVNWNSYYQDCRAGGPNPHMGAINFDNIGYAYVTIFQVVTLEGWSEIMFNIMDAHSFWSLIFFILVTIMGSFIMLNVCAVVIATQYANNTRQETVERSGGTVAMMWLWSKVTSWMLERCSRRHRRRIHCEDIGGSRKNEASLWGLVMKELRHIVGSTCFDNMVMFAVFLSILFMAIEHHNQPKVLTNVLQTSNIIFTFLFVVEMMLKLLTLRWMYFTERNNIFDFAIVIVSLWELFSKTDGRLSVLRAFRLLRFVRLVRFLPYLERQLLLLKRTMKEATTLCMLLLVVTLMLSIMGMQLFGDEFNFKTRHGDVVTDRKNFDSLIWSMVTVFQILSQEDWNLVLYNAMAATSPWAAFYFVFVIVLGKHVLLNILVGIVVESFQDKSTGSTIHAPSNLTAESPLETDNNPSRPNGDVSLSLHEPSRSAAASAIEDNEDNGSLKWNKKVLRWCKEREDWSFYVLSPQNKFRVWCQNVISHKLFDPLILVFILLSCVTIAMERPGIDPESTERWILNMSRYVFSTVFLIEMLFKVLALGLLFGKDSYSRSSWNIMDGLLVILSLVHIIISLASSDKDNMLGILKVLRLLRTLRPLRVIKRAPQLKLAVEALIASVKPIGNIVLISVVFFFFYGLLGLQLFKGKFFSCVGPDIRNITNKTECLSANCRWVRKTYNFDSLPQALISLFVMYSKDGWISIMYDGLDAVGIDIQPVTNYNKWMLLFFIPYMIASFVLLDMFIGVMVETFHKCQQEQKTGKAAQGQNGEPAQTYHMHYSPLRQAIHRLCTSNFLDLFMVIIIFISVIMMAFEHYNQPPYITNLIEYSHCVFTIILIIEVLLKLVAFGPLRFIQSRWNLLDVAVVLFSIFSIVFNEMKMAKKIPINPSLMRVCRVLRLTQVLKSKRIQVLLKTIIKTLSQVGNICLLFIFFFFIYAALGVELFGKIDCTGDKLCWGLHRHANFHHFGMALITLYQVCTGDNWSGIMKDTLRKCRKGDPSCVSYVTWVSPIYFTSFVVMAQFVLVNLVVAAIMQALEDSNEEVEIEQSQRALPSPGDSEGGSSSHDEAEESL